MSGPLTPEPQAGSAADAATGASEGAAPGGPAREPSTGGEAGGAGFFGNLSDLYFAPAEGFRRILARPAFLAPLLLLVGLNLAFTGIWMQKVDKREFMKNQIEASGRWEQIPPDRRADVIDRQVGMFDVFAWLGGLVFLPIAVAIMAAVFLFVFRFFYAAELDFKRALTIVACAFAAVSLVTTPLLLAVMSLKGDWNMNPQEVLQANLTLALDRQAVAKPLYSLAASLDLISFWMMFLIASGLGAAARKPASWAAAGVIVPWALYVLAKVGLAAIF